MMALLLSGSVLTQPKTWPYSSAIRRVPPGAGTLPSLQSSGRRPELRPANGRCRARQPPVFCRNAARCTSRFRLALGVDQQASRKVEGAGLGEQLIEIGVGHPLTSDVLVLGVAHERTGRPVPPRQVRLESNLLFIVQRQTDTPVGTQDAL